MKKIIVTAITLLAFNAIALEEGQIKDLASKFEVSVSDYTSGNKGIEIKGTFKKYRSIGNFIDELKKLPGCSEPIYSKPSKKSYIIECKK